jgi:hypothetical protein
MKAQVEILCVVTLCSVAAGYQRFGGPCCHHLQDKAKRFVLIYIAVYYANYYTAPFGLSE